MYGWTFFLLFLSVHSRIVSTATVKLLCHFGFVCVLILDYAVHIFHSTESRYAIFVLMQIIQRQHDSQAQTRVQSHVVLGFGDQTSYVPQGN